MRPPTWAAVTCPRASSTLTAQANELQQAEASLKAREEALNASTRGIWSLKVPEGEHPKEVTLHADGSVYVMPFHGVGGTWSREGGTRAGPRCP